MRIQKKILLWMIFSLIGIYQSQAFTYGRINYLHRYNYFANPKDSISKDSTSDDDKYRKFIIENELGSNTVVKGRLNGKLPYSEPEFTYDALSGFTCGANITRIFGKYNIWDDTEITAGWNFDFTEDWDASIAYAHQFYNSATPKLNSITDNTFTAESGYDFDIVYTSLTAEYDFGTAKGKTKKVTSTSENDFCLLYTLSHDFEIDHIFRKKKMDELDIEPKFTWEGGTQNFYDQYLKKKASETTGFVYNPTESSAAFKTLYYEFSLPLIYTIGNFELGPEWDYYIPENVISTNSTSKPYSIETFTLKYTFKSKK